MFENTVCDFILLAPGASLYLLYKFHFVIFYVFLFCLFFLFLLVFSDFSCLFFCSIFVFCGGFIFGWILVWAMSFGLRELLFDDFFLCLVGCRFVGSRDLGVYVSREGIVRLNYLGKKLVIF